MPAPANDTCATAEVIASLPFSDTVDVTDATAGPDTSCITTAEHTIWYSWTAPSAAPVAFTLVDDRAWGSVLTVYTGTCVALTEVLCEEPYGGAQAFLVPTSGVTYLIQLSVYDGVLGTYPSVALTVTLEEVDRPPAPVLSGSSTTGRTVSLTWASLVGTNTDTVSIERSLDGLAWTVVTSVGIPSPYHDRTLTPETVYFHRIRGHHATLGYGPYSNTVTTTTLAATVGVVQYGFAIGGTGGFGRMQTIAEDGSAIGYPATLEIFGVFQLWEVTNALETQPGGINSTIYHTAKLLLKYVAGTTTVNVVTSGYVLSTQQIVFLGPGPVFESQVQYSNINHQIDIWGRLGSVDTVTNTHAADGAITVTLDGVPIFALEDIPLGTDGVAGWTNVAVHPAGTLTTPSVDPGGVDQNGGLSHFYVGLTDEQGASDAFDYTFADLTDAELFADLGAGPWLRFRGAFGPDVNVPALWGFEGEDARLSDSSVASGFAIGWMSLEASAYLTPPDIWEEPEPEPEPEPPGTVTPSYHLDARYIRRLRRAPHLTNENLRVFYRRFELDLERGQALASGQGSAPVVLLRISRDGGQTWGEEQRLSVQGLGHYTARVISRRLGHGRDLVFEVVVSDPIAWSLVGAWLDLEPGTS